MYIESAQVSSEKLFIKIMKMFVSLTNNEAEMEKIAS